MNFRKILNDIEKSDPVAYNELTGRREILKSFGAKVAVAALPIAIGSLLFTKKAAAKTTDTVTEALNFALSIAYFQYNFYHIANNTGGLIPRNTAANTVGVNDLPGFLTIETNVRAHIVFLNTAIKAIGGTPYTPKFYNATDLNPFYVPTAYDFTMDGTYEVFSDYPTFLRVAQVFQDTFVRALKGQIPVVIANTTVLTQLVQMQSTEARHAAHVRFVHRHTAGALENPAPWITNDIAPSTDFMPNYDGEDNLVQTGGVIIDELTDTFDNNGVVPKISATAAFDETLSPTFVATFMKKFTL